ncbi:hypothetical protein O181_021782 [Austropuccinia psidii MF-1]|uniref:Uncharacterized protein n=1 Tax=Austropuccinia psidii MF-1 TaxID=1389203 RepID=A0A9Q3GWJ4_9BASI|nr:hypothetical protein [Austropuccinia psidii MF-1]
MIYDKDCQFMHKLGESKKQATISPSSCEAEYKSQYEGGKDLICTERLLKDVNINFHLPLQPYGNNQGAISLAKNPQVNERTKHFDTTCHWNQERLADNTLKIDYAPTQNMPSYGLTKSLPRPGHQRFLQNLGLVYVMSEGSS